MHRKEILFLIWAFILIGLISGAFIIYSGYLIKTQNKLFNKLYNHPLKVSNTALNIQLNIYKMHRDMKDIVLYPNKEKLEYLIYDVNKVEYEVYNYFRVIKINILGEKGQEIQEHAFTLFKNWKKIRTEVIKLAKEKRFKEAIAKTQNEGATHVLLMDEAVDSLYEYAQNKARTFRNESNNIIKNQKRNNNYVNIILFILFVLISYYTINRLRQYIFKNEQLKSSLELKSQEFEKIFNESPNPIMLHSESGKVLKVNKIWKHLTGYSDEEINTIEKWTLKAYGSECHVVKEAIDKLYSIDKTLDEGVFSIKTKDKKTLQWQFSSAFLGVIDNERVVISSAMDITELKSKDEMLILQSRSAAMGEMINMIAHQWRQPLTVISMIANNTLANIELDEVDNKQLKEDTEKLTETSIFLSETIDDFRNFFKLDKQKKQILISEVMNNSLKLIGTSFKNNDINLSMNIHEEKEVLIFSRELMQVFINILNNAKEALTEVIDSKIIQIDIEVQNKEVITRIFNNKSHIEESIIHKIFEPYFSTKKKKNGTGLGLYMSKVIVEEHCSGRLEVENNQDGVTFIVAIPYVK